MRRLADYSDRPIIYITGYPRSGTTWACRSLAHAIGCPSLGMIEKDEEFATDLAAEGFDRKGDYVVRKSHFSLPRHHESHGDLPMAAIVLAVRDPRDVAVSCWHYWMGGKTKAGLTKCVRQLCGLEGRVSPLIWGGYGPHGTGQTGWSSFVADWLDEGVPIIEYERHLDNPSEELRRVVVALGLPSSKKRTAEAACANLFAKRKRDVLMRRGIVGEWKEVLTPDMAAMIVEHCGDVMERLGYEYTTHDTPSL